MSGTGQVTGTQLLSFLDELGANSLLAMAGAFTITLQPGETEITKSPFLVAGFLDS
jgi:hypothetical protein